MAENARKISADKIVVLPIDEVRPYEKNPRKNSGAVKYVKESIRQFGFKVPIVIDSNRVVVCGHTRLLAAKSLGMTEVPCIMADDLTDDQVKAFRLADNKVGEFAEWDMDLLGDELDAIADASDIDMESLGFGQELDPDQLGDSFSLPDGDKNGICQWTITFAEEQKAFIENVIKGVECSETFGNANENGNHIYEVVKQWAAQRK